MKEYNLDEFLEEKINSLETSGYLKVKEDKLKSERKKFQYFSNKEMSKDNIGNSLLMITITNIFLDYVYSLRLFIEKIDVERFNMGTDWMSIDFINDELNYKSFSEITFIDSRSIKYVYPSLIEVIKERLLNL